MLRRLLFGALLLANAYAQTQAPPLPGTPSAIGPSSTYVESTVPTGTPVPGNYTGPLRPQVHYSPPAGFMNDPNGMFVDDNGTWHLYYQYNPTGIVAGNQHWGHATSTDLYHWINQPIAIFPPNNETFVFSGSCVIDVNNTSGFFPDQTNGVVAIYTLAEYPGGMAGPQQQAIAYSRDGGYTFTPYEQNPVIPSSSSQFRDPKVIWYEDHWVMVIAYAQEFTIGFFSSPDLKTWTPTSNFTYHGLLGLQYECPNLVEVPVRGEDRTMYVLAISINPGAPLGGSITEYFPGFFNGVYFEPVDGAARLTDFGKDNYAGQFFYGTGGPGDDAISIAWASNWQYTQVVPQGEEGFRSQMSLPRRQYLANMTRVGMVLYSEPYNLEAVRGPALISDYSLINGTIAASLENVPSGAVYFEVNATGLNSSMVNGFSTLNFTIVNNSTQEYLRGGYYFGGDNPFFIDRGGLTGFDNVFFTDKFSTAHPLNSTGTWSMSAVYDRSIFEAFIDGGAQVATVSCFPSEPLTAISLSTNNIPVGASINVAIYALYSAWAPYENEEGIVVGNVTTGGNATAPAKRQLIYEAKF